nr:hypothetical protein [Tanacetum cinerariifolium]
MPSNGSPHPEQQWLIFVKKFQKYLENHLKNSDYVHKYNKVLCRYDFNILCKYIVYRSRGALTTLVLALDGSKVFWKSGKVATRVLGGCWEVMGKVVGVVECSGEWRRWCCEEWREKRFGMNSVFKNVGKEKYCWVFLGFSQLVPGLTRD